MLEIIDSIFSRISQHAPFLYHQDRLFYLTEPSSTIPKGDFVKIKGTHFSLQPGLLVSELENHLASHSSIREPKKAYLRKTLSAQLVDNQELTTESANLRVVSFIFEKLFPLLIDAREDLYQMTGEEESSIKPVEEIIADAILQGEAPKIESLEADKQRLITQLERNFAYNLERYKIGSSPAQTSLFSKLFRTSFAYINNSSSSQIFFINGTAKNTNRDSLARLNGKYFKLDDFTTQFPKFPNYQYDYLFDASLCINTLRELESQDDIIAKQRELRRRYSSILKSGETNIKSVGFVKYNNFFFVYVKIPKFAMQHPFRRKEYSKYPSVRVAAKVYYSDTIHVDGPYVIEPLRHPFIPDYSTHFMPICIIDEQKLGAESKEKETVNIIINGIASLTNGLTKRSIVDYHGGDPKDGSGSMFYHRSLDEILNPITITREQALAQGYALTNQFLDMPKTAIKKEAKK